MKKIMPSHSTSALVIALAATLLGASCSQTPSVQFTANKLNSAAATEVVGYNGSLAPASRSFVSAGALPTTVKRAMVDYIKTGEWQNINYAYPQTFVRIEDAKLPNHENYWAVCIDARGNLVGIMPAQDARTLPTVGAYKMVVNKTPRNAGLSYAILKGLQNSDSYRKTSRKSIGLDTPSPAAPIKVVAPPAAPKAPKAVTTAPAPAAAAPAAPKADTAEDDPFGGAAETPSTETTTETATETTETQTPAETTETTATEEVSF